MPRVVIAAATDIAADAGASIADAGGNAVDAAVAAIVASMCTEPGVVAPGASGFITVDVPGQQPVVIDGYAEMAGRGAEPDRFGSGDVITMGYGGGVTTVVGYGSIAAPGMFAALEAAATRWGALPWQMLLEPAIDAVRRGFPVGSAAAEYLIHTHESIFGWDPEGRDIVHDEQGRVVTAGDLIRIPELADSLTALAEEGARTLYEGDLGKAIAAASAEHGGLLTMRDLREYRIVERRPTEFRLAGWRGATNPPPAVGGVTAAGLLALVDHHGLPTLPEERTERLYDFQRAVLGYRRTHFATGTAIEREAARFLEMAGAGDIAGLMGSPSTSHTSAADSDGRVCAITVSAGYGSGAMPAGTGFWLNNSLGELELNPAGYHGLEPGTRLVSNMAPTTVRSSQEALAIGSPGADRITTALSSVLIHHLLFGTSLEDSVRAPRFHAEIGHEDFDVSVESDATWARLSGQRVRLFDPLAMYFGGVQATSVGVVGELIGVADPRRAGQTAFGGAV